MCFSPVLINTTLTCVLHVNSCGILIGLFVAAVLGHQSTEKRSVDMSYSVI